MSEPVLLEASGATLFLPDGASDELTASLRVAVADRAPIPTIVSAMTRAKLTALPSFACIVREAGRLRVLVRGTASVTVVSGDGEAMTVAAQADVTTWHEEVFGDDVIVELPVQQAGARGRPPVSRPAVNDPTPLTAEPEQRAQVSIGDVRPPRGWPPPVVSTDATLAVPREDVRTESEGDEEDRWSPDEPATEVSAVVARSAPTASDDFDFSHLIEETQYRGVEAAAVRDSSPDEVDVPDSVQTQAPMPFTPATALPVPEPLRAAAPAQVPARPGLISSVPGIGAVAPDPSPTVASPVQVQGDHDGHTIAAGALREVLAQISADGPANPGSVQAVFCVASHPNPPHAPVCRVCRGAIEVREVRDISRPTIGRLRLSTGAVVELDRPLLIGRRPSVDTGSRSEVPGLITFADPEQSLSRTHAEVRLDAWEVFVVDLDSRNGTVVEIPGQSPTRLRGGEPFLVVPGSRVVLADVVDFRFEVGEA